MRRNPPMRWVLPQIVDPPTRRCIQIQVPDDPAHIAAFRGALLSLASAYNWADDPAHTAKDVALVWRGIVDGMTEWGCEMPLEFMQDDCGLYSREVGVETWTQIYDGLHCLESDAARAYFDGLMGDYIDSLIDDGVLQRGGGQTSPEQPPSPGDCTTVHASIPPGSMFLLPMQVNEYDTIAITNITGGWALGELTWYCPDGYEYLLGQCFHDLYIYEPGDPLPTARHMQLIVKIGDDYYDPLAGTIEVPAGTTDQAAYVLANTALTGSPSGGAWFDLEVCRNADAVWTYHFQFATGEHGFTSATDENGCESHYTSGAWHACTNSSDYTNVAIRPPFYDVDAFHLTGIRVKGHQGALRNDGGKPLVFVHDATSYHNISNWNAIGDFDESWAGDLTDIKLSRLIVCTSSPVDSTLTDIYISGLGYCPYIGQ